MTEENLMLTISADPILKDIISKVQGIEAMTVPSSYEEELSQIIKTKISIIGNIDGPEDYRALQQATFLCRTCKDRVAVIRDHLCRLEFMWTESLGKATKYVETKYFSDLAKVREATKKSVVTQSLYPLSSSLAEITYYMDKADRAAERLQEVNWAIRSSSDTIEKYYTTLKMVSPATMYGREL